MSSLSIKHLMLLVIYIYLVGHSLVRFQRINLDMS